MKYFFCSSLLCVFLSFGAIAQEGEFSQTELVVLDLLTLSEKFATPGAEASMHQSSAGWYVSAKKMNLWEVDFSIHTNVIFLPNKKKTANISNSEFNVLTIQGGAETVEIPTALGGETSVIYEGQLFDSDFEFQSLEGIQKRAVAYPFVQASVGLPFGTNLTARFLPVTEVQDVEYKVAGIGLQHNLTQYLRENKFPGFDFSFLAAYSHIGVFYPFKDVELPGVALNKIMINGDLFELQLIASKEYGDWEVFSALGLTTAQFNYQIGGRGEEFLTALNRAYERLNATETMVKADVGFNYNLKRFSFNSVLSVGAFINYNLGVHYRIL